MKMDASAFQDTTVEWAGRALQPVRATRITRTIYCLALLAFALPALGQGASWIAPATGDTLNPVLATWLLFLISAAMAYRAYHVVSYADTLDARPPYLLGWLMRWLGWLIMLLGIAGLMALLLVKPAALLPLKSGAAGGADYLAMGLWATVLASQRLAGLRSVRDQPLDRPPRHSRGQRQNPAPAHSRRRRAVSAMTPRTVRTLMSLAALVAAAAMANAQSAAVPSRGQLLYATHCIDCHNTQIHWRERKLVRDWASLKVQVRRWQAIGHLGWDEADIDEVARYLNQTIYRYPQPTEPLARD